MGEEEHQSMKTLHLCHLLDLMPFTAMRTFQLIIGRSTFMLLGLIKSELIQLNVS